MSKKILIADDQELLLEVLAECLEDGGYEPLTACDGSAAIQQFVHSNPDLVITDLRMPHIDGFEVCRFIRQTSDVPIIMMTSLGDTDQAISNTGLVDVFITKPVQLSFLLTLVENLLGRSTCRQDSSPAVN